MFVNKDLESKLTMIYGWNKSETEVESFMLKALVSDQPRLLLLQLLVSYETAFS